MVQEEKKRRKKCTMECNFLLLLLSKFKLASTQVNKYTSKQYYKFTSSQVHKFTSIITAIQVYKNTRTTVHR